jgi:hypothetical protein
MGEPSDLLELSRSLGIDSDPGCRAASPRGAPIVTSRDPCDYTADTCRKSMVVS